MRTLSAALVAVVLCLPAAAFAGDEPAQTPATPAHDVETSDLKDPFAGLPEAPKTEKKTAEKKDAFEVETNDLAKPFER